LSQAESEAGGLEGMLPADGAISASPDQALIHAISKYWAIQALRMHSFGESIGGVEEFRQQELGGHLLLGTRVQAWITEKAIEEGPPSFWMSGLPLNRDDFKQGDDGVILSGPLPPLTWYHSGAPFTSQERPALSLREVLYIAPKTPRIGEAVRAGGTLDRLRRLSLALSEEYEWEPEQATVFILAGLVPLHKAYAETLGDLLVKGRRPREMSLKHLELAVFTEEHEGKSLAVRMTLWNALHPDWAYPRVTNFGWDSQQALRRLSERMGSDASLPETEPSPSLENVAHALEHRQDKRALWSAEIVEAVQDRKDERRTTDAKSRGRRMTLQEREQVLDEVVHILDSQVLEATKRALDALEAGDALEQIQAVENAENLSSALKGLLANKKRLTADDERLDQRMSQLLGIIDTLRKERK